MGLTLQKSCWSKTLHSFYFCREMCKSFMFAFLLQWHWRWRQQFNATEAGKTGGNWNFLHKITTIDQSHDFCLLFSCIITHIVCRVDCGCDSSWVEKQILAAFRLRLWFLIWFWPALWLPKLCTSEQTSSDVKRFVQSSHFSNDCLTRITDLQFYALPKHQQKCCSYKGQIKSDTFPTWNTLLPTD